MYGPLKVGDALIFYERLAKKYCFGIGWRPTFRALANRLPSEKLFDFYAHPSKNKKHSEEYVANAWQRKIQLDSDRQVVILATNEPDGKYCLIDCKKDLCTICLKPYSSEICSINNFWPKITTEKSFWGTGRYGSYFCRSPMCKALLEIFPSIDKGRFKKLPIANIILELTKNGDRTAKIREIEEAFARHVHANNSGRHRQKEGKGNSRAGAIV